MTASLAAAIRRHVEEMEVRPERVEVHPDDWRGVLKTAVDERWTVLVSFDAGVPRGCWRMAGR